MTTLKGKDLIKLIVNEDSEPCIRYLKDCFKGAEEYNELKLLLIKRYCGGQPNG